MKFVLFLIFIALFSVSAMFSQTKGEAPSKPNTGDSLLEQRRQQAETDRKNRGFDNLTKKNSSNNVTYVRRESIPFKISISREQRERLEPDKQLAEKYSAFLKQPRAGLVKLFPDAGCEDNSRILRADAGCLKWIPNSAFYSFREKEHTSDFFADIAYRDNTFISNGVLSQGILTALGNIPLENVSLSTDGMRFLADYQPALQSRDALKQFQEILKVVKSGDFLYAKALTAVGNMTYAARIIAYKGKYLVSYQGRLYDALKSDKRLDLIVAFRVVAVNNDGSVSVLWKELSRKDAPTAIFPKKKK